MFKASVWIAILTLLGSGLGFFNQVAIAHFFGASKEVDKFLFATSVPTFVAGMISSILSYAIVPKIAALSINQKKQAQYLRTMLIAVVGLAVAVCIGGCFLSFWMVPSYYDSEDILLINRVAWLSAGIQIVVAYFSAVCVAFKYYIRPAIAALLPYLAMLMATVCAGTHYGVVVLPAGLFCGTLLAFLYLIWSVRVEISKCAKKTHLLWNEVIGFLIKSPLIAVAMSCFSAYAVIDAYFAPRLGEAALSYLGYSQRILIGVGGLIISGPSAVLVPHFSSALAEGRYQDFQRGVNKAIGIVIGLALPIAFMTSYFSEHIVRILFMRGAFDERAVLGVAQVLAVMIIGMVPMLTVVILFRIMYCFDTVLPQASVGLCWVILYFSGSMIGYSRIGVIGIAYSYVGSWLICSLVAFVIMKYRITKLLIKI